MRRSKQGRIGLEYENLREDIKKMFMDHLGVKVPKPQIDNLLAKVIKENNLYPKLFIPKKGRKKRKDEVFI